MDSPSKVGFKSIQLLREEFLGEGSYGGVCKARCDDLTCAAKIMHSMLLERNNDEQKTPSSSSASSASSSHKLPIERFEQECEFLRVISHPNIIQFLGIWRDPSTNLPVLLMELMDESLTKFLEKNSQPSLSFHTEVNICHDIAMALSFLHSNGIIHRDLSSNNVLMIGDKRAKVSDFGMARLWDMNNNTRFSLTKAPGCVYYMPPETTSDQLQYSSKLDCFSFGVLAIQILTCCFPKPGKQFKVVYVNDPKFPKGIETRSTEVERRKDHIDAIRIDHPLLPIALNCIKDIDTERPSSSELCLELVSIKETSQYSSSSDTDHEQVMDDIVKQIEDMQNLSFLKDDVEEEKGSRTSKETQPPTETTDTTEGTPTTTQELQVSSDHRRSQEEAILTLQLKVKDAENGLANEQEEMKSRTRQFQAELESAVKTAEEKEGWLNKTQEEVFQLRAKVEELERKLELSEKTPPCVVTTTVELKSVKLLWDSRKARTIEPTSRTTDAVVTTNEMVYLRPGGSKKMQAYSVARNRWEEYPDVPCTECSLAIIKRKLSIIGGKLSNEFTDKVLSLIESDRKMKWVEIYPTMSVKRSNPITTQCKSSLVAAGGEGVTGYLKIVEVLDTNSLVWSRVADLPEAVVFASVTANDTHIFIMGGWVEKMTPTYTSLTVPINNLIQSSPSEGASPWQEIAHLPLKGSTCIAVKGRLLSIGGRDVHQPTTAIHIYNPVSNSWGILTHMSQARHQCYAAVVDKKLLIMGGWMLSEKQVLCETNLVEIATIT